MVAFKFHMDRLFGEASTRKTNAAGYLIQMANVPRNQNLVVGVKTGVYRTRVGVLVLDIPLTHGRLDLVRIGKLFVPLDFDP